jgi:NAD(P)-dependent dehydrogenase (short-subunit alcohol dehydrogenase family)
MSFTIDLSGRRALVTGAGRHTGRRYALALAAAGAHVAVNDIDADLADAVAREIRDEGGSAEPAVFDVTDLSAVTGLVGDVAPDILVNNTGGTAFITYPFPRFEDDDPETWRRLIDINLYGVLHCTRAALPHMRAQGWGRIITIISDAARTGERGMAVYGAAKAGAAGFMRGIAAEVGADGVTANCIALGTLRYEQQPERDPEQLRRQLRNYAIKREGRPTDPVGMVMLLVSEHADWITGQVLPVNGGYTNAL